MTRSQNVDKTTPVSTKDGKRLTLREPKSEGPDVEHPNASVEVEVEPEWKDRPSQYPATKTDLLSTDLPGASKKR
jgi:hypothetical protein